MADPPPVTNARRDPDLLDYDGAPLTYTVSETLEGSVVRIDPDQRVIDGARVSGAECFSALQEGPDVRSAVLNVTVIPGGSVSRTEVAGVSEPQVVDCLHRIGDGLHFSARDESPPAGEERDENDSIGGSIRSFSIDIRVARAH